MKSADEWLDEPLLPPGVKAAAALDDQDESPPISFSDYIGIPHGAACPCPDCCRKYGPLA